MLKNCKPALKKKEPRFLLVSEKDAVKLKGMKFSLPVFKVVIELEILEGRETFNKQITTRRGANER